MFTPSNMLLHYLNAEPRDMFDIVGALMGYINADPQFKTDDFEQAVQYVLSHGVTEDELFAPFNKDIEFEEEPSKWNEEYYSFARVYLKDNFSRKRIEHVKAVARKLYPRKASEQKVMQTVSEKTRNSSAQMGGSQSNRKKTQSQQYDREEKTQMSSATKVMIAVVVIVLLALVIGLIAARK